MNNRLWRLSENECSSEQLVAIAVRHVKLALEHLNPKTSAERKRKIVSEITQLREEREALLGAANRIDKIKTN